MSNIVSLRNTDFSAANENEMNKMLSIHSRNTGR